MGKKNRFSPGPALYCEGSPLLISAVRPGSKNSVQLTVAPVTIRAMQEAEVCLIIAGTNEVLTETIHGTETGISDGATVSFRLPNGTEQYTPGISSVIFEDGTEWNCIGDWTPLTSRVLLEDALGSNDVAEEFRAQFGTDCRYFPQEERGLWTCTCGTSNLLEEERCMKCRRKYAGFRSLNINALKDQSDRHAEISHSAERDKKGKAKAVIGLEEKLEQLEEDHERRKRDKALLRQEKATQLKQSAPKAEKAPDILPEDSGKTAPQKKKLKTVLPFVLIPVVLVVVVLLATIPGFLQNKERYMEATQYLAENQFDKAEDAFAALGLYGDSKEQVEKNIPYEKAIYLIHCANNGDSSALTLLGLDKASFENSDQIQIALYTGAAELLQTLDGYKDSADQIEIAEQAINEINLRRMQESYETAMRLLEQGCYNQAKEAFAELADYEDSAAMIPECDYRKACELLTFCEKYNVRGVYALISDSSDTNNLFSLNNDAALRIGTDGVAELYSLLTADGAEVILEDTPSSDTMVPFCDATVQLLESIKNYQDSAELEQRAKDAGDFTKPFYEYCASGDLNGAIKWLNSYDGEFNNREEWLSTLKAYLPMTGDWQFVTGDPTLIPLTAGTEDNVYYISTEIAISGNTIYLRIYFNSSGDYIELYYDSEVEQFALYDDFNYFSSLNNSGNLTYVKYGENGLLSSCEYSPA